MQCGCGISIWLTPALTCRVPAAGSWELSGSCNNCSPLAIFSGQQQKRIANSSLSALICPLATLLAHTLLPSRFVCLFSIAQYYTLFPAMYREPIQSGVWVYLCTRPVHSSVLFWPALALLLPGFLHLMVAHIFLRQLPLTKLFLKR